MKLNVPAPCVEDDARVFPASEFMFEPPPQVGRARRILIKPCASYPLPYPVTTSRETMECVIEGIRKVSDADILLLERSPMEEPMRPIYRALGYDFPRVLTLDVRECVLVEVENPLPKPLSMPTFWLPNVILSCDYLITIAPLKILNGRGNFSVENLLRLLPVGKYRGEKGYDWSSLYEQGIDKVIADLYFTLPFDLGIIDARQKFIGGEDPTQGRAEEFGKILVGEPFNVDCRASRLTGAETQYLKLIDNARASLNSNQWKQDLG